MCTEVQDARLHELYKRTAIIAELLATLEDVITKSEDKREKERERARQREREGACLLYR